MNAFRTLIIAALGCRPARLRPERGRPDPLHQLQTRWAEINYQLPEKREEAFGKLVTQADAALAGEPKAPELLIWRGIILSTQLAPRVASAR
uniref:Tetratricopeptide repeat-containing protein n=1 Tax=Ectopseudomonas oleovorans TaxID=301 RepID=A0A653AXB8_ECTOL